MSSNPSIMVTTIEKLSQKTSYNETLIKSFINKNPEPIDGLEFSIDFNNIYCEFDDLNTFIDTLSKIHTDLNIEPQYRKLIQMFTKIAYFNVLSPEHYYQLQNLIEYKANSILNKYYNLYDSKNDPHNQNLKHTITLFTESYIYNKQIDAHIFFDMFLPKNPNAENDEILQLWVTLSTNQYFAKRILDIFVQEFETIN